MTSRGGRAVLGMLSIGVSLLLALLNHGIRVTSYSKEELILHGILIVAGISLLSTGGFKDVADGLAKFVPWKGKSE